MSIIRDAATGVSAKINTEGQMRVTAESESREHYSSRVHGQTYQAQGTATLASGTTTVLHLKNTSTTRKMVVSFVRLQIIDQAGGTALPAASNYWELGFDEAVASGGTEVAPVNLNRSSGNTAEVTATYGAPTMSGTFLQSDVHYAKGDGDANGYDMAGGWILGQNDTVSIRYVGDQTSGTAYGRFTFTMTDPD